MYNRRTQSKCVAQHKKTLVSSKFSFDIVKWWFYFHSVWLCVVANSSSESERDKCTFQRVEILSMFSSSMYFVCFFVRSFNQSIVCCLF